MKRSLFSKLAQSFCAAAVLVGGASAQAALVGFWDFENTLDDVSGNGNHGTAGGGGPSFNPDAAPIPGSTRSLSFTGGQHVVIANEQNFDLGNNITVSTWVKGGLPGTWDPFISKNGEPNGWQLRRHGGDATIDWTTRRTPNNDFTDFASTNDAAGQIINSDAGNWHHIVGTFDGKVKKIYIDGVLNNLVYVPAGAIADSPDSVIFGGRQNPGPTVGSTSFEGSLDNVAIYSNALAPNQVAFLAGGGNPAALPAAQDTTNQRLVWDFGDTPNIQDWTVVNGAAFFRPDDGGGVSPANSGGGFAHDGDHTNFLMRSPIFHFNGQTVDGLNAIIVEFAGGAGDQSGTLASMASPEAAIDFNGGNNADNGAKAVGILDLSTNTYLAFITDPSDGNVPLTVGLTPAQLESLGLTFGAGYRLDFFENDEVSWGWGQLNRLEVAGALGAVPEPATALMGVMGLGLLALRRRRAA